MEMKSFEYFMVLDWATGSAAALHLKVMINQHVLTTIPIPLKLIKNVRVMN